MGREVYEGGEGGKQIVRGRKGKGEKYTREGKESREEYVGRMKG